MVRIVVVGFLALAACSVGQVDGYMGGGGPDGGGGGGGGGQSFSTTIAPLVTRCVGCHSGVQMPNLSSFSALGALYKQKPGASNILVTKGTPTAGKHEGIDYLSAADQATVAAWIDSL